jgi:hypothetical protein
VIEERQLRMFAFKNRFRGLQHCTKLRDGWARVPRDTQRNAPRDATLRGEDLRSMGRKRAASAA